MEENVKEPTRVSQMTEEERNKLVINISENIKKLKVGSDDYIKQLKVLNMLTKKAPKKTEVNFDFDMD